MTKPAIKTLLEEEAEVLQMGLKFQEEGLRVLFSEIRALQAMIPVGERELPTDAETLATICTGFQPSSAVFLMVWAANFGVV